MIQLFLEPDQASDPSPLEIQPCARLVFPPTITIVPSCKAQIFWMFKKENSGTDEYVLNWNHGLNNGNIKPK